MARNVKPNFLFITTDQQRWDALGIHNDRIRTPAMDGLARDGMRFDRAYPTNAICAPARASMITGRSQRGHHVFNNVNLSEAVPVVGDALRQAGYTTALLGKAHFKSGEYEDALPEHPPPGATVNDQDGLWYGPYFGFDYVEMLGAHAYPKGHWRVWLERNHPEGLELWKPVNALEPRTGAFRSWKNAIPAEWHYTHRTADRTIDWLRSHDNESPFFLWMSFYDPHMPFAPPRPYCDMYDPAEMPPAFPREDVSHKPPQYGYARDGLPYQGYDTTSGWEGAHHGEIVAHYYGLTTFCDDGIGRVLAELDRLGLAENTHVVFTSDHGEGLGDHGIAAKPMMSYEAVNRVPMIWRHMETVPAGSVHEGVMTQLDLVPTFLDLAGAPPLVGMEGRSFAPLLRGEVEGHRDAVIVERIAIFGSGKPELVGNTRSHPEPIVLRVKMLVTSDWKLLHYGTTAYGELYDVQEDPDDLNNLWDDPAHAAIRAELVERLLIELINDEGGDPHLVMDDNPVAGQLRNADLMEPQPVSRADLSERIRDLMA